MMNNGGPAFPGLNAEFTGISSEGRERFEIQPSGGMSLRDYFAAKAMQAEIITSTSDATPESAQALIDAAARAGRSPEEQVAFNAYEWADAMLAAREAA